MTGMRTRTLIVAVFSCALALSGCYSVDPLTMDCTARDDMAYEPSETPSWGWGGRVYVISRVIEHQRARETNHVAFLAKTVESSATEYFANLGWFRTLGVGTKLEVDASGTLAGASVGDLSGVPQGADYVLVAESSVSFMAKQGWKMTSHSKKARGVRVETDFRFINRNRNEVLVSRRFHSEAECGKGGVRTGISEAVDKNVRKFARVISARYLPPGRVTETRGAGRCARLSIGKNYLLTAKSGKRKATRVDFFEYEKANGEFKKVVIAQGTVISADKKGAWVEVDADWINKATHLATYKVKKGHFVQISEAAVESETEAK